MLLKRRGRNPRPAVEYEPAFPGEGSEESALTPNGLKGDRPTESKDCDDPSAQAEESFQNKDDEAGPIEASDPKNFSETLAHDGPDVEAAP